MRPPPPAPVLDRGAAQELNLTVLRRIDPDVEEVLATAGHVCLYHMSVDTQQWARKNVEGSLFVLKRRSQPRFQMMVLNKLCTENYTEAVHGGLEFEVNGPYLMYTHGNSEIHGIWFYEREDLERVSGLLTRLLHTLPKPEYGAGGPAVVEPTAADDGSFWDKPRPTAATAKSPALLPFGSIKPGVETPSTSTSFSVPDSILNGDTPSNLANLLRKAHAQTQNPVPERAPSPFAIPQPAPSPHPVLDAQSEGGPALLPPSFFNKPAVKNLEELKKPAALSPATSFDVLKESSATASRVPDEDKNHLKQLFARARKEMPVAPVAPKASVSPSPTAPAEVGNVATTLLSVLQAPKPQAAPTAAPPNDASREQLRQAMFRIFSNDAVMDIVANELRNAGLLR